MTVRQWGISITEKDRTRKIVLPEVLKGTPKDTISVSVGSNFACLLTQSGHVYTCGSPKDGK
jgi:alpha-tubulin suppressor-like RCC1 family protein